jgi:hypothetical protein
MSPSMLIFVSHFFKHLFIILFNGVFFSSIPGKTQVVQCLEYAMDDQRIVVKFPAGERCYLSHVSKPALRHIQAYVEWI